VKINASEAYPVETRGGVIYIRNTAWRRKFLSQL